ncbi:DHA1 family bicyclomycin/chloramphenicol resistance-like MFS transporter [Sediminihabitans luteus]|uniref:DHA1 family bicyclomycin/chloramphenicol resistance-like MFS transporter n=2 Tax=Sediminihabitans luteus TaxID=1138585 RepID=A0A2M9CYM8_9CELL|nr:multidrug effflux MFS transporter [Sediminihabitans luteus]PJJ76935.1 DHA1 family bicyclomycin/chloramphenicol resistance-like MFS transporter [Sediminihabitans luteus]GII99576.1 Bcr/CflA family drug resistance efflux transporter [Sediminihabitans luteus]
MLGWILLLGALATLPAFTVDTYLPALPDVAEEFGASDALAQLTLSGMLVGGAVGQFVIGPLSDRFGRRLPVLVGLTLHVVTSIACAFAPSIETLIVLRVLQGFFNAASQVVSIAVIRDQFTGAAAARILSRLMLVIGLAPLLAPSIGALILADGGWRWVFGVLAILGVALGLVVLFFMPETHPVAKRRTGGARSVLRGYASLFKDRHFVALAVLPGLGMAVLMSYVVGSPFVLQEGYDLTHAQFSVLFAVNGVGLVISAQVNAALVRRVAPIRLLRAALVAQAGFAVVLLVVALTGAGGLVGLLVALWLVLSMQGMIPANASALALSRHGEMAGTAAAVIGAFQSGVAGVVSPLVGVLGGDATAMATVMVGAVALSLVVLATATPAFRRGGWHTEI